MWFPRIKRLINRLNFCLSSAELLLETIVQVESAETHQKHLEIGAQEDRPGSGAVSFIFFTSFSIRLPKMTKSAPPERLCFCHIRNLRNLRPKFGESAVFLPSRPTMSQQPPSSWQRQKLTIDPSAAAPKKTFIFALSISLSKVLSMALCKSFFSWNLFKVGF